MQENTYEGWAIVGPKLDLWRSTTSGRACLYLGEKAAEGAFKEFSDISAKTISEKGVRLIPVLINIVEMPG